MREGLEVFIRNEEGLPVRSFGPYSLNDRIELATLVAATGSRVAVETGLAFGTTSTAILAGLSVAATPGRLISVDPFADADPLNSTGLINVAKMLRRYPQMSHEHVNRSAVIGLAQLYDTETCPGFMLLDDGHLFDQVFPEMVFASLMLPVGGVVVVDDGWMPSVKAMARYVDSNYNGFFRKVPFSRGYAWQKTGESQRSWQFHNAFQG